MADQKFTYEVAIDAKTVQAAAKQMRAAFEQEAAQAGKNSAAKAAEREAVAAAKQAAKEQAAAVKQAEREAVAAARVAAKEKAAIAKQAAAEVAEAAREAAYAEASAAKQAAQQVRAAQAEVAKAFKAEQKENVAAAKQAAREIAAAEQAAARTAAQSTWRSRLGRAATNVLTLGTGGIGGLAALGLGGLGAYAGIQAGQQLYGAGREGASMERTALVLEQSARALNVSAQAMLRSIQEGSRGTIATSEAQTMALQLLSQKWAPTRENIAGDAELLAQAARLFSQRYATAEGQAMSSSEVIGRLMGYIREGNKELIDQFGFNNAMVAQAAGVENENVTAEARARGLFKLLGEEIARLADVTGTNIERIQQAEVQFSDAMARIKISLAGPTAAAASWAADQLAMTEAQMGTSDLTTTRAAVTAVQKPTPLDDLSDARKADLQAAEQYLDVAERYDKALARNADAAGGYMDALNRLGQAITQQNGLTADQYTELNKVGIKLDLIARGQDAYSLAMSKTTQAGLEENDQLFQVFMAMQRYEDSLAAGRISMEFYERQVAGLTNWLGSLAVAAGYAAVGIDAVNGATNAKPGGGLNLPSGLRGGTGGSIFRDDSRAAQRRANQVLGGRDTGSDRTSVDPLTGALTGPGSKGDRGKANDPLDVLAQENADAQEKIAAAAQREWQSAADKAQKAWEQAAEDAASAFKSALEGVPGLFGTSDVTEQDMADAAAGTYQEKADEYLRQLRDEVLNKKDYAGVDLADIASVAGVDQSLSPEAQLRLIERKWEDSSLFANPEALRFVNQDAVAAFQAQQQASEAGRQNLYSLFGLGPTSPLTPEQKKQYAEMTGTEGLAALGTGETPAYLPTDEQMKTAAKDAKQVFVTEFAQPAAAGGTAQAFVDELLTGLDPSIVAGDTADTLKALGTSIFGAIYSGYSSSASEADWPQPVVDGLVGRVLPAVLAAIEGDQ